MMLDKKNIGFIGLGLMGHGLAKNLLKHGHAMKFLDHPGNQPSDDLVGMGAVAALTPRAVALEADVVFICVTGSPQVEAIVHGPDGVLAGLREGAIVVDATTADPVSTMRVAKAVADHGGRFVDAPMTRTPQDAEAGRVNVMVGGDEATIAAVRPLIETYSENIFVGGPVGSGHRLKLLHNYITLGTAVLLSEAYMCAGKGEVDLDVLTRVLVSGGGDSVILKRFIPFIENADPNGMMFTLINACKDMRYFTHMAEDLQVGVFAAEALHQTYVTAANVGGDNRLIPEMLNILCEIHNAPVIRPRHRDRDQQLAPVAGT